jgi:hypothetical protein
MKAHLTARDHKPMDLAPALYAIRIKGQLGPSALTAFPALVRNGYSGHGPIFAVPTPCSRGSSTSGRPSIPGTGWPSCRR